MPDYQKSKIYRIVCNITGDTYYGSTCQALCNRKAGHKAMLAIFNKGLTRKCASFDIIERGDWSMFLVENYPCNNKEELLMRERHYIENNECLNKKRPIVSVAEYKEEAHNKYLENIDKHREYNKAYREGEKRDEILAKKREYYRNNKDMIAEKAKAYTEGEKRDEILAKKKEYYRNNKDMIAEKTKAYREGEKRDEILAKQREYYHNNKDMIAEKKKTYREANKETKILKNREYYAKNKDKVFICECGAELKWSLSGHKKSKKHKDFIAQKELKEKNAVIAQKCEE